jgi:carbon monoxide dehydrogenase subunit G
MIHFEGEHTYPLSVERVAEKLSDAGYIVGCLEGVDSVSVAGPDRAVWKIRPRLSFLTGSLDIAADVTDRQPGESVRMRLLSKGIGATVTVEAVMAFAAIDSGASVRWSVDVTELTGFLKLVPRGLIQGTAGKVIADSWASVGKKLVEGA